MRNASVVFIVLIASIAGSSTAIAEDCADPSSQLAMNACADQEFVVADKELNSTYRQVMGRLKDNPSASALLIKAQRAWLSFRDAQCDFSTSASEQGSIYPMIVSQCRSALTHTRSKDLGAFLHCEEGDLSCPVPAP
jgi:uncharacterized protein YecT (DUF1311 family)